MRSIEVIPLTIETFQDYGSIVSPDEEVSKLDSNQKNANQGTAIKLLRVSKIVNEFPASCNVVSPNCNIFRCFPLQHLKRQLVPTAQGREVGHEIKVLEKHPFSSQTFIPMGREGETGFAYMVITACPDDQGNPDLDTLKAFLCKSNQAVTYGAGVWHAPMIVIGPAEHLDFTVIINEALDKAHPEFDLVEHFYEGELSVQLYECLSKGI